MANNGAVALRSLEEKFGTLRTFTAEKNWEERWFEIRDSFLFQYDRKDGKELKKFPLVGSKVSEWRPNRIAYCVEIVSSKGESIIMQAPNGVEMQMWFTAINKNTVDDVTRRQQKATDDGHWHEALAIADIASPSFKGLFKALDEHIANKQFETEWLALEKRALMSDFADFTDGYQACNQDKNRYGNIVPLNSTRVKLQPLKNEKGLIEGSDYVNANHIKIGERKYIATQAPLPNTIEAFYRMIWENNINVIVMLTKLVEAARLKADLYIPEDIPVKYGDIQVEAVSKEQAQEQYVLTKLKIKKGNETRDVLHYQYITWLDHMTPHPESILHMMEKVNSDGNTKTQQPAQLVHCSAGIGRTGTWIAIQYMIDLLNKAFVEDVALRVKTKGKEYKMPTINLMKVVDMLRTQRAGMFTSIDQYQFLYETCRAHVGTLINQ